VYYEKVMVIYYSIKCFYFLKARRFWNFIRKRLYFLCIYKWVFFRCGGFRVAWFL